MDHIIFVVVVRGEAPYQYVLTMLIAFDRFLKPLSKRMVICSYIYTVLSKDARPGKTRSDLIGPYSARRMVKKQLP
jgi:hypothetical protein